MVIEIMVGVGFWDLLRWAAEGGFILSNICSFFECLLASCLNKDNILIGLNRLGGNPNEV